MFAEGALLVIGHVAEIAELRIGATKLFRLWLDACFRAPRESLDGSLRVPVACAPCSMLIRLESVAVTPLIMSGQSESVRQFRRVV